MRKHEILYDWPIGEIQRLADSETAVQYADTLAEEALSAFTTLTEQMRNIGVGLSKAKAERVHFNDWDLLQQSLASYEQQFGNYPNAAFNKFNVFLLLAANLFQSGEVLDTDDINGSLFEIRELSDGLPLSWFARENAQSFDDSVAVFSLADLDTLRREFSNSVISPTFAFHLLAALATHNGMPSGQAVLVKKSADHIGAPALDAFVRLVILASGKSIHAPRCYTALPHVLNPDFIKAGHVYQQWNEVINVLSEYNSRDEILLKYLTIYHVVENLMYKFPIVELERQNGGRMFSIRDFRRLYHQVPDNESTALKRLFTAVFKLDANPGVTFESHITSRWSTLTTHISAADIEQALGSLGIQRDRRPLKPSEFKPGGECAGYFTQMVYSMRCAIVHNKETELHLTYASLDSTFTSLLEVFLLPSLEEICFELIGHPNNQVWYSQKELLLYQ